MTTDCKSPRSRIAKIVRDLPRSGIRDFFDIVAQRHDVISLGIGEPDFVTPWHVCESAISSIEHGATHYTSNLGLPELRKSIVRYLDRAYEGRLRYDWQDEVLVTVGVSEALDLAIRAICEPGDEIMFHEPCFVAYPAVIRLSHGVPVVVETYAKNDFRLTREALEAKVTPKTKALLINFPCNPTGAVLDYESARMIADFVTEHDLLLISDEVYAELTYDVPRISPVQFPGMHDRTIFLSGFSKAWAMTGFRLGYVCAPPDLTAAMMKVHQYGIMSAPTTSQKAGVEAMDNGWDDIEMMRNAYRERRNLICAAFADMGLPCFKPDGAFYVFPCIRGLGLSSHDFAMDFLNEESVACVPGTAFGACGEGYLRCSYATDIDQIREAMLRLARFVQKRRRA